MSLTYFLAIDFVKNTINTASKPKPPNIIPLYSVASDFLNAIINSIFFK